LAGKIVGAGPANDQNVTACGDVVTCHELLSLEWSSDVGFANRAVDVVLTHG